MTRTLAPADYVVFGLVLAASATIGVYYSCTGGRQRTSKEYLMGNRQMSLLPTAFSLLASFMSAITLLGLPAEIYQYGTHYWTLIFCFFIVAAVTSKVLIPIFYEMQITSVYEYLEKRFRRENRMLASLVFVFHMSIYMGIQLYLPSLAIEAGIAHSERQWEISVCLMGVVCCFYTVVGGIKAVMWTDVFQITVMFAGMAAVVARGSLLAGGFQRVWAAAGRSGRIDLLNFSLDASQRNTIWSTIIGGTFIWLTIYGVSQTQVQRYCAARSLRVAQLALWLNVPGVILMMTMCCMAGLVAYAYYEDCDPLSSKRIHAVDQILPIFVMDVLSTVPGFAGLFIATVFSASLSTVSSLMNSLAAVVLEDCLMPLGSKLSFFADMSEERRAVLSKLVAMLFSLVALAVAFSASLIGSNSLQIANGFAGMLAAPILGVFLLGMFFPCANWIGALVGHLAGTVLAAWISLGQQTNKFSYPKMPLSVSGCPQTWNETLAYTMQNSSNSSPLASTEFRGLGIYTVSYMWIAAIAVITTVVCGLLVSVLSGGNKGRKVDAKLLFLAYSSPCYKRTKDSRENCRDEHLADPSTQPLSDNDDQLRRIATQATNITTA